MLAVGGGLISQLHGVSSVKTDAKKFESTSAFSSSVSVSIPFGFFKAGIASLMVVFWRTQLQNFFGLVLTSDDISFSRVSASDRVADLTSFRLVLYLVKLSAV